MPAEGPTTRETVTDVHAFQSSSSTGPDGWMFLRKVIILLEKHITYLHTEHNDLTKAKQIKADELKFIGKVMGFCAETSANYVKEWRMTSLWKWMQEEST